MTFKEQMTADISSVFFNTGEFADLCDYTPRATGIAIKNVSVIINFGTALSQTEFGAAEIDTAEFIASEIGEPKAYDTFCFNDITYTIRSRISTIHGIHTVSLDTDQRQSPSS